MVKGMSEAPRSVKIRDDERGGWSSDRPRRPGEPQRPPRKPDVGVRGRVLAPTDRLRYAPGSLLVVVSPDRAARDRFLARALEEQSTLLSMDKVRSLLAGKVPADEVEAKAGALLDAAAGKRLAAGQTVVIAADGLTAEERERYVRLAAPHRRPRHLILLEASRDDVAESDRGTLTELRTALDAGALGAEGFATSLRLGGRTVGELKRIVFAPPPSDD
jgi:predicted kinase